MFGKKVASLAVVTAVIAGGFVLGSAATANASTSECNSGSFCIWDNYNFGTKLLGSTGDIGYVGVVNNDRATSWYNHGVMSNIRAYDNINYAGDSRWVPRGSTNSNLVPDGFNDKVTSWGWFA